MEACVYRKNFHITIGKHRDEFKVLAIIHCFNEVDIIAQTLEYLLANRLMYMLWTIGLMMERMNF